MGIEDREWHQEKVRQREKAADRIFEEVEPRRTKIKPPRKPPVTTEQRPLGPGYEGIYHKSEDRKVKDRINKAFSNGFWIGTATTIALIYAMVKLMPYIRAMTIF